MNSSHTWESCHFFALYNHYYILIHQSLYSVVLHTWKQGFILNIFKIILNLYLKINDLVNLPQLRETDTFEKAVHVNCMQFNHIINYRMHLTHY